MLLSWLKNLLEIQSSFNTRDNIFYGHDLTNQLVCSAAKDCDATIFAYRVQDPSRFGIINLNKDNLPTHIEENQIT